MQNSDLRATGSTINSVNGSKLRENVSSTMKDAGGTYTNLPSMANKFNDFVNVGTSLAQNFVDVPGKKQIDYLFRSFGNSRRGGSTTSEIILITSLLKNSNSEGIDMARAGC